MGNIANSRLSSNFIACCRHIRLIDCPNDSRWYHCSLVQWPWFETLLHLLDRFCLCPIDPAAADIVWYSWQIQVFLSQIFTVFHYPYTQALQPQAAPPQHLPSTSPAPPQHLPSTSPAPLYLCRSLTHRSGARPPLQWNVFPLNVIVQLLHSYRQSMVEHGSCDGRRHRRKSQDESHNKRKLEKLRIRKKYRISLSNYLWLQRVER